MTINDPTVKCPQCGTEIKLTESLAAPMVQAIRQQYEQRLTDKDAAMAAREQALQTDRSHLAQAQQDMEKQVKARLDEQLADGRKQLAAETARIEKLDNDRQAAMLQQLQAARAEITNDERTKARYALANDLQQKAQDIADLQEVLKEREGKLAVAQRAQADLIIKQRELDDAKREMDLTIQRQVQAGLASAREQAKKETEDAISLRVAEKEQTIASMRTQIEDLQRKATQGSQQLQGEVQELQLEGILTAKFPHDRIEPVPKGEFGGDIIQRVVSPSGIDCGTILWESKRTKNWSGTWLPKLRDDQRSAKAEIAAIVTAVLPEGVASFDQVDGIWVMSPAVMVPVAMCLRQMLIEVHSARSTGEGQQTKMEMMYHYLTGPKFRLRVQAIVEAFSTMKADLDTERRAIGKQWVKREDQIERVTQATIGMYAEMQAIAGATLQQVEGLEMQAIESGTAGLITSGRPV